MASKREDLPLPSSRSARALPADAATRRGPAAPASTPIGAVSADRIASVTPVTRQAARPELIGDPILDQLRRESIRKGKLNLRLPASVKSAMWMFAEREGLLPKIGDLIGIALQEYLQEHGYSITGLPPITVPEVLKVPPRSIDGYVYDESDSSDPAVAGLVQRSADRIGINVHVMAPILDTFEEFRVDNGVDSKQKGDLASLALQCFLERRGVMVPGRPRVLPWPELVDDADVDDADEV